MTLPFWNIFFFVVEIFTFLYYTNKKCDDVVGGSTECWFLQATELVGVIIRSSE